MLLTPVTVLSSWNILSELRFLLEFDKPKYEYWDRMLLCSVLLISFYGNFRQEVLLLDNEIVFNEAIIDEREQGIQEIQQQIGEVNEIFKDLAVLVHDQGVMIGRPYDFLQNVQRAHSLPSCC